MPDLSGGKGKALPGLAEECTFRAVRSSGSGGQHVNKVSTKVELYFSIPDSAIFSEAQKQQLLQVYAKRLDSENRLRVVCGSSRSQQQNKKKALLKLETMLLQALRPVKKRRPTSIPRQIKMERLDLKKKLAQKKAMRKKPSPGRD